MTGHSSCCRFMVNENCNCQGYYSIFRSTIGPKPHWSDAADEDYKVITGIDK